MLFGTRIRLVLRSGLESALKGFSAMATAMTGELHYATDTGRVYAWDGTRMLGVSPSTVVCHDGEPVVHDGELLCN
jgi:hypothetical protein